MSPNLSHQGTGGARYERGRQTRLQKYRALFLFLFLLFCI